MGGRFARERPVGKSAIGRNSRARSQPSVFYPGESAGLSARRCRIIFRRNKPTEPCSTSPAAAPSPHATAFRVAISFKSARLARSVFPSRKWPACARSAPHLRRTNRASSFSISARRHNSTRFDMKPDAPREIRGPFSSRSARTIRRHPGVRDFPAHREARATNFRSCAACITRRQRCMTRGIR